MNSGNICFTGQCWILGKHGNNDPSPVLCCFVTWTSNQYIWCPESPKLAHEYKLHCLVLISLSTGASTSLRLWGQCCEISHSNFFFFYDKFTYILPPFSLILPQCSTYLQLYRNVPAWCLELRNVLMSGWMDGWGGRWMAEWSFLLYPHTDEAQRSLFPFSFFSPFTLKLFFILFSIGV